MPPIDPEYRPYFLTQRIEQTRKFAESGKTADVITTMVELMGACDCWRLDGGLAETARKFCEFVQKRYQYHGMGHLPPVSVSLILTQWIKTKPGRFSHLPIWPASNLYLFGWLAVFALREDFAPVCAWVEFAQYREEFVIHGVREIEN